jgi:hypothetical protein
VFTLSTSFVKETVSGMLTGLIVSSMSPRKKGMHDCQKPSDMLLGCVIISLEQYLDSVFFFFFQSSHGLYLFIFVPPSLSFLSCSGTSYKLLLFVRLEGLLYSLNL